MLDAISVSQSLYLDTQTDEIKKELGQFFTDDTIADYMSSMIKAIDAPLIRILDAGAGAGILTITAALKCLSLGNKRIHAVLYEIDSRVIPLLQKNMNDLIHEFSKKGGEFSYTIHNKNFVLERPDQQGSHFHLSVINPPYFKYNSKTSLYAGATSDLYKGNPNIYASFMAIVATCMMPEGQMIAIVPRSFTNGLYFKGFRKYLNASMNLQCLHIFKSRNKVFSKLPVLQENIICQYKKEQQQDTIKITSSEGYHDLDDIDSELYQTSIIIDPSNDHEIIRIPETREEGDVLECASGWKSSFQDNGYFISTGPVVEHRTRKYITLAGDEKDSVPLMKMHNIKKGKVEWTGANKKDARFRLIDGSKKHTTENNTYIFLKRFTSKDEKKRLVTGVYEGSKEKKTVIALENHLNYVGREGEKMDLIEAYGLTTLLNSTFMDQYFRCISGNTQVNATEIRLMKLPERHSIRQIGTDFLKNKIIDQMGIDLIVNTTLKI